MLSRLKVTSLFLTVFLFTLGLCYAQQGKAVTGKWNMVSISPDGDHIAWTLTIAKEGAKYTATVAGNDGTNPARDVKIEGTSVHFRTTYEDEDYDIDLKLQNDKLTGTWSGNGNSGTTSGTRAATSAATTN